MSNKDFCHLHCHTVYSILDGINKTKDLAKHVKAQGMSSCAITDHGVLHGVVDWWKAGVDAGIKPIIGVEAYLTDDEDGIEENKDKTRDNYHCILLAQNQIGLRNLFWLTNRANLANFYYRPRISIQNLQNSGRSEGIIATSSCLGGVVSKRGSYDATNKSFTDDGSATRALEKFASIFHGKFYAEIQDNPEFWQQTAYNTWLLRSVREMGIPTVITADAHCLRREDKDTHDLIMAQQLKCTIQEYRDQGDEDGLYYGNGHYIRSPEEMYQAAIKHGAEEAFWNTTEIAKQCQLELKLGEYQPPIFDITKEDDYDSFRSWKADRKECDAGFNCNM